jgi:hypothetical protein
VGKFHPVGVVKSRRGDVFGGRKTSTQRLTVELVKAQRRKKENVGKSAEI